MVKLSARALALSLCLGLAFFAGQPPVAAHGHRGPGLGKKDKKDKSGGKQEDPRDTVKRIVTEAIGGDKGVGAALIRLVFHDCWVNGCDGSVLVDTKPYGGGKTEKLAENNIGLAGFDVIDKIKSQLDSPEKQLSCADIVVLAAREATYNLSRGNIDYPVNTGRTDGVVSSASAADAVLPPSTFDFEQLKANFAAKGFDTKELVALSGAHVVGVARESSFADRLNDTTATPISPDYKDALAEDVKKHPIQPNNIRDKDETFRDKAGYVVETGVDTSDGAKGVMDNTYYHANLQNRVLFRSDWELRNDMSGQAGNAMETFKRDAREWYTEFGKAMAKLSQLKAQGPRFENRTDCKVINTNNKY
uniref:Uncharacterized protein n=1 Tax=Avena sativa TaxID=4498 RepID=A0ACD5TXT9_AVESA